MRISLPKSQRSFSAAPQQSLLDAALDASLNLPHSCKGGNCGSCRARLLQGEIHYPHGRPLGLSDAEAADGWVLLCQARARTDLAIEVVEVTTPELAVTKRLPARIEHAARLSHDVMGLHLRLPAAEAFDFQAGQYIDVILAGGRRRSFSIASPPHDSRLLELHVRRVAGGEFSDGVFAEENRSALLTIEGPLGQFVYRSRERPIAGDPPMRAMSGEGDLTRADAAPLLMVAGGTGIAPLLSILRQVVEQGIERDMTLFWGVRSERDLYAHERLQALAARAARLHYVPVLSEPSPDWRGRRGWVHEAVLADLPDLSAHDVYAAGPPAMVAAVRREFGLHGADPQRLYFDSFDYAPDALERQRKSADTKS